MAVQAVSIANNARIKLLRRSMFLQKIFREGRRAAAYGAAVRSAESFVGWSENKDSFSFTQKPQGYAIQISQSVVPAQRSAEEQIFCPALMSGQ